MIGALYYSPFAANAVKGALREKNYCSWNMIIDKGNFDSVSPIQI